MPKLQFYVEVTYGRGILFAPEDTEAIAGILTRASVAQSEFQSSTCRVDGPIKEIRLVTPEDAVAPVEPPARKPEVITEF